MWEPTQAVAILSDTECWRLLADAQLGRLVTTVDGEPSIFPVNFAVHGRTVLFRTALGTKLVSAVINDRVLFEVDHHDGAEAWSVIVKGIAQTLRGDEELDTADRAGLISWTVPSKGHVVRIRPLTVTGRRFILDPDVIAASHQNVDPESGRQPAPSGPGRGDV